MNAKTHGLSSPIFQALRGELKKVRRSKTLWVTGLAILLVSLVSGLFMFILQDPERAQRFGLVGTKAQIFGGTADWPSLINLTLLMLSVGGLIIFGFIFIWIFGREFTDKTVYDLLSLPTSRLAIVTAKFIAAVSWSLALVVSAFFLLLCVGTVLQLPGWSAATILHGLGLVLVTGLLSIIASTPFALAASVTRGYLPAVAFLFLALVSGQIISQLGYGQYFPWTIPLLFSGAAEALAGRTFASLGMTSYAIVAAVGLAGSFIAGAWWQYADQT